MTEIDWSGIFTQTESGTPVALREVPMGMEVEVTFNRLTQTANGGIVANVETSIEGDTIWLKGQYGPQSGLYSLISAAGSGENIEGNTFVFSRVESEKSPTGYAYRWVKPAGEE